MRGVGIISVALAAAVLHAQQPVQPKRQEAPKPEACIIEGQILSKTTGEPLSKASILLMQIGKARGERYTTTTTAGGRFALQDIEPGKYQLQAMKTGYAQFQFGVSGASRQVATLSLDPGQHLRDIILRLVPQAVITGRVVDEDGEPMPNVSVEVLRYRYMAGKRQLLQAGGDAGTNDLGEYRIFGLAPGRYYLAARPQAELDTPYQSGGWQSYAPTYYPGTSDPAGATTLELSPGARLRGVDFTLMKTRSVRLGGRAVLAGTGRPIESAIRLVSRDPSRGVLSDGWSFAEQQGVFQFRGVVPGAYFVQSEWSEDGKSYSARQPIDVRESDIANLVVELTPGAELPGRVRVEGRPIASLSDIQVSLQPDTGSPFMRGAGGPVKRDGNLTISGVRPDHYRLNTYGVPEDYYIKSARWGDKDVLEAGLDFTYGETGAVEILLSSNGGHIEGVVLNAAEQPVTGATVVLVPDEPRRAQEQRYKEGATDQYGRFDIKGIAPGGYKLFAWEEMESGAYKDPDFLKPFEALGERKAIREGSRESAQLKLIPAESKKVPANRAR
jgi:protocatechuate 3,4-dioxygenase beta subunit